MLIKVRELWEAQGEGAFGFFKGISNPEAQKGNGADGE